MLSRVSCRCGQPDTVQSRQCSCCHVCLVDAGSPTQFSLDSADAVIFHSPFCKLVQKSVARLMLNDFLKDTNPETKEKYAGLDGFR